MAAAVVAVLSPAVSTCEPLSAAAVGVGAEVEPPAIGTSTSPPPPPSGLSTAKVTGTVFPNAATTTIIFNNNNITTTRGDKPNSSSSANAIAVSTVSSSSTTDSPPSFAPPITSSVNYENTCEQNPRKTKYSTIPTHITATTTDTNSISSSSSLNRTVIIKTTSSITACSVDDGTEIANTTTWPGSISTPTTTTTTKTGTTSRATAPPPPSAPTIATTTTTTTSVITTSVVASCNNSSRNSLCNNSSSSSSINHPSFISTKTTTTNSTSIISTTLKANGIVVSGFPSLDISGSPSTSRITNDNEVCLRTSASIVTTMRPEEKGYPEVVSNQNDGTGVIIVTSIASTNPSSTAISSATTADSRRRPQNSCKGNNGETHTNHLSLNNEHNHNNNNNNNNIERSGFNIQHTTNCIKTCPSVNIPNSNNYNDNIQSADNTHCTVFAVTCSSRNHNTDNILRVIDGGASSSSDSCNDSTRNIRKHKHHINNNDDNGIESTTDDSDFDSQHSGVDSFSCQAVRSRTTTPSNNSINNNNNNSSSSNSIDSCGSSSIVSTSITSTCATKSTAHLSNTTGNNTRSSFSKSVITNGISASLLSTLSNSIIIPTFKRKSNAAGVTKINHINHHTNTNHDLDADTKTNDNANAHSRWLSRIKVATKNESNIKSLHILNNAISTRTDHSQDNEPQGGEETDYTQTQTNRLHRPQQDHTTTTPPSEKPNRTPPPPLVLAPPPPPPPPPPPTTTTRKNKRKLSEPRKRTDFSIKRFCSDNDGGDANYYADNIASERKETSSLLLGSAQEIIGVDSENNRIRLNNDEALYDRVEPQGRQPLLSQRPRPLVQLGHPSTRALLDTDMYCRSLGRITPTAVGQPLLDSCTVRGDVCSSPPTPLPLYQRRSREDEEENEDDDVDDDDDDDDDDDADDDDDDDEFEDLDEDLDPDDIDEEVADGTSPRSHLRLLCVSLARRHRRLSDGGAARDEAGNLRTSRGSRTGVIRNHETNTSRRPVSTSAVTTSSSETVSSGREPSSANPPIPNAHTAAAAATAVIVPGSLSPLSSIPTPPAPPPLPQLTSHLNGFVHHHHHHHHLHNNHGEVEGVVGSFTSSGGVGLNSGGGGGKKPRKNYKNMTRERRIEANARERSRVHTISAAFENLRRAVPSYSCNQKLSKLAILRIACCYILALARLADMDYSEEQSAISFAQCVDICTKTIQTEGRARRRH